MTNTACHNCKEPQNPTCNQCGKVLDLDGEDRWGTSKIEVHWGYHSTGKDTDFDRWHLCKNCTKSLEKKYPTSCGFCDRKLYEVMAEIDFRNPHCASYGNLEEALEFQRNRSEFQCDSYAMINDRICCELCYDALTASFVIPLHSENYMISSGDTYQTENNRINRTQEALKIREGDTGDSLREMYETSVALNEMQQIITSANASDFIAKIRVEIWREAYRQRHEEWVDSVYLTRGDNSFWKVELAKLKGRLADRIQNTVDDKPFKTPKILDGGRKVSFESHVFDSVELIQMAIPDCE